MGWTDLFKSKNKRAEASGPDGRVRWFGKLPTYADYYSSPTDQDWVAEFNEWILKGYEVFYTHVSRPDAAGAGRPRIERRLPQSECIVRLPRSGMTVFASMMDYGGDMRGRPFPMFFYVGLPTSQWPGPTSGQAASALRTLDALSSIRTVVARFLNSPGHFETVFGGREVDVDKLLEASEDNAWLSEAEKLGFASWCDQAGNSQPPQRWLKGIEQWGEAMCGHDADSFDPTLQFPVASGISTEVQLAGWLLWLGPRLRLAERRAGLVLARDNDDRLSRLAVVTRSATPDDFLLLTPLWTNLHYVDDLSAMVKKQGGDDAAEADAETSGVSWAGVMRGGEAT